MGGRRGHTHGDSTRYVVGVEGAILMGTALGMWWEVEGAILIGDITRYVVGGRRGHTHGDSTRYVVGGTGAILMGTALGMWWEVEVAILMEVGGAVLMGIAQGRRGRTHGDSIRYVVGGRRGRTHGDSTRYVVGGRRCSWGQHKVCGGYVVFISLYVSLMILTYLSTRDYI